MSVKRALIVTSICLLIIIAGSCFIFYREFNRVNRPIMAGFGLIRMMVFNMDYITIQEYPKIIIAKPNNALDRLKEYMNIQGFRKTDRLGSFVVFQNDASEEQSLSFRANRYYSIWEWRQETPR